MRQNTLYVIIGLLIGVVIMQWDIPAAQGQGERAVALYRALIEAYGDSTYLERKIAALEGR